MENRPLHHIKGSEKIRKMLKSAIVLAPVLLFLAGCAPDSIPLPAPNQITAVQTMESRYLTPSSEMTRVSFLKNCLTIFGVGTKVLSGPSDQQSKVIFTVPKGERIEVWNGGVDLELAPGMLIVTMSSKDVDNNGHTLFFIPLRYFTKLSTSEEEDSCRPIWGHINLVLPFGIVHATSDDDGTEYSILIAARKPELSFK